MVDEKVCPRCAETVKAAAQVCRFCGYEFAAHERAAARTTDAPLTTDEALFKPDPTREPKKRMGCMAWIATIVGGLFLFGLLLQALESPEAKAKREAEEQAEAAEEAGREAAEAASKAREESEKRKNGFHCLSSWDGSHTQVKDAVKESMRNPDSFEHIDTRITPVDKKGRHTLIMKFRAENGFGGMNVGYASATVDNASCSATITGIES